MNQSISSFYTFYVNKKYGIYWIIIQTNGWIVSKFKQKKIQFKHWYSLMTRRFSFIKQTYHYYQTIEIYHET